VQSLGGIPSIFIFSVWVHWS